MKRETSKPHRDAPGTDADMSGPLLQRSCGCGSCDECTKRRLRRSALRGTGAIAPPSVNDVVASSGRPLEPRVRSTMERRFGSDFSRVRVHDDGAAAASAEAVGAKAYTVGSDVVFNRGRYAPDSSQGQQLLAHELTHVEQQRDSPEPGSSAIEIGAANDAHEREAQRAEANPGQNPAPAATACRLPDARVQASFLDVVVDVLAFVPRLFGAAWFTANQLREYLDGLRTRRSIENGIFSDNKARACVSRESEFGPYDVATKILLVTEMNTGHVSGFDEGATIVLLRRTPPAERQQIVSAVGRDWLWSGFSGRNRRAIEALTLTAADANDALVGRLRTLDADALQDYRRDITDPALLAVIRRAELLSQITAPVPNSAVIETPPAESPIQPLPADAMRFDINGIPVYAMPDTFDPSLGRANFTSLAMSTRTPRLPEPTADEGDATVGTFAQPEIRLYVRTRYGTRDSPDQPSGYGVGTRPGEPKTVRHHERTHSQTWFDWIRRNPPPRFTGQTGMTRPAFTAAVAQWQTAVDAWQARAVAYSQRETDCVGTLPTPEIVEGTTVSADICRQQPAGNAP